VHRRTAALAALVAALALLLPATALAAGATLRGPADGVVSGATSLDVRVTREAFEAISAIDLGLRRGGAPIEGSTTRRLCEGLRDCPNSDRSADFRVPFDPRTGSPFLPSTAARMLPNGAYELRVSIEIGRDTQERSLDLTLSVPPASPSDVRASAAGQQVTVEWGRASEPDLAGYRVERAAGSGSWSNRAQLGASSTAFADEPGPGTYRYRVVALRPDGKGGTYEVTSREASVTVAEPPREDASQGRDGSGGDGIGDDGSDVTDGGRGDEDGARPDGDASDQGSDAGSRDDDDREVADDGSAGGNGVGPAGGSGTRSSASTQRRSAQAPSFNLDRGGANTPALPWDDPEYFQEELAYDAPETADPSERRTRSTDDGEVLLSFPGAGAFGGGTDGNRAAIPIAGGLLMTAMGLHLWRWLKVPLP
jgi:hypothetical protein